MKPLTPGPPIHAHAESNFLSVISNITDVSPLASLTNLTTLRIITNNAKQTNTITDISPLAALTNLTKLYLGDNNITLDQIHLIRQALPNCRFNI